MNEEIKWRFKGNNYTTEFGLDTSDMETFKKDPIASLTRESCQNSIDAKAEGEGKVKIEFQLFEINKEDIPGEKRLEEEIESCKEYRKANKKIKDAEIVKIDILDTAGIRETDDVVESIGVKRSVDAIDEADLVLFVVDSVDGFTDEDAEVLEHIKDNEVLVVYNKNDVVKDYKNDKLKDYESINISTFDSDMISKLKDEIAKIFDLKSIAESNYMYISNARQIALLNNCIDIIGDIDNSVKNNELVDMIEIDVKKLWETLSEITGEVSSDDLLDEIFSKFCLGK